MKPPIRKKQKKKTNPLGYSSDDARDDLPSRKLAPIKRNNSASRRLPAQVSQTQPLGFNTNSTIMEKRNFKKPVNKQKRAPESHL